MSRNSLAGLNLFGESLRIGAIILTAFIIAGLVRGAIGAAPIDLLYGFREPVTAAIRYTGVVTAVLYAVARATQGQNRQ